MATPTRGQRWLWRLATLVLLFLGWRIYATAAATTTERQCHRDPPVLCASQAPANWTRGCTRNDTMTTPEGAWWTCATAIDCVRPPAFWVHPPVLEGWPARFVEEPAPLCGGRLTYLEALRQDWPPALREHGPAAACAEEGAGLAEVLAAYDLNTAWAGAPVRPPPLLLTADRARLALDDCCAGLAFNASHLHALTAELYAYTGGTGALPACPDPYLAVSPAPSLRFADAYARFMYVDPETPTRLTPGGQAVVGTILGVAGVVLLGVTAQTLAGCGWCR